MDLNEIPVGSRQDNNVNSLLACPECDKELETVHLFFEVPAVANIRDSKVLHRQAEMDCLSTSDEAIGAECPECGSDLLAFINDNNLWQ